MRSLVAPCRTFSCNRVSRPPRAINSGVRAVSAPTTMQVTQEIILGMLKRIDECNTGTPLMDSMVKFAIQERTMGYLKPSFVEQLEKFPHIFTVETTGSTTTVTLNANLKTPEERTESVAVAMAHLRDSGFITGWRNELLSVSPSFHSPPLMLMERAAIPFFGLRSYGVHVNGYVEDENGDKKLWVARRSRVKPTWPGKLDHIVAGAQPHGISCFENVIKECEEEASIPRSLASKAQAVGAVSYIAMIDQGLKPDVLFCYDLKLPNDFVPTPCDGEVEEFMLWPLDKVAEVISLTDEYKPNCTLVIMDFLIRHGYLTPDTPGYLDVMRGLRPGDLC